MASIRLHCHNNNNKVIGKRIIIIIIMCRICGQYQETIDHIVARCPELPKTEYLHRHDKAASYLHWNICKELNINIEEKWYEHEPQTVTERDNITILWDMPIQTDPEIKANRPDIVIKTNRRKAEQIPGNIKISELQKIALLGTSCIRRKTLYQVG